MEPAAAMKVGKNRSRTRGGTEEKSERSPIFATIPVKASQMIPLDAIFRERVAKANPATNEKDKITKPISSRRLAACRTLEESTAKSAFLAHFCPNYCRILQYSPQIWAKMVTI